MQKTSNQSIDQSIVQSTLLYVCLDSYMSRRLLACLLALLLQDSPSAYIND